MTRNPGLFLYLTSTYSIYTVGKGPEAGTSIVERMIPGEHF